MRKKLRSPITTIPNKSLASITLKKEQREEKNVDDRVISFGRFETATVLINVLLIKVLLGFPQLLCRRIGSAAWISSLISGILLLLFVALVLKLYDSFENKNILEIAYLLGGKVGRWICAAAIFFPFVFQGAITLRLAADTIHVITPYRLPSVLTAFLVGATMVVSSYRGTEGIVRIHALLVPVILLALAVVGVSSVKSYRLGNLFPFWGLGKNIVWSEGVRLFSAYTDVIYIFLLYPYVKSRRIYRKACIGGTLIAMAAQSLVMLGYVLCTQYPENAELFMPVYQISRIIRISGGSQSIEALFYPVWISSSLLYLSLSNRFAAEILGQASGSRYEKLFIVPIALLMFVIAYFPSGTSDAMRLAINAEAYLAVFCILVPFLILLAAFFRKRTVKQNEK